MTTFVRRIPASFDDTYWRVAAGYMERELGAVEANEAVRHEAPRGFASVAGKTTGQRKDQPYCFAPYDGLRGLGMADVVSVGELGDAPVVAPAVPSLTPSAPSSPSSAAPAQEPAVLRAVPYVIAAVGLLWLFNKTAKETAPVRAAR